MDKRNQDTLNEARELGKILPCYWTATQRERVIVLTGKPAEVIDEIIRMSRALNGLNSGS